MLMPVLFWVVVVTALSSIGFAAWKLAVKVDREEAELLAWKEYVCGVRLVDPQRADYLEWVRETGQDHLYYSLLAEQMSYQNQQNQQGYQQGFRQW